MCDRDGRRDNDQCIFDVVILRDLVDPVFKMNRNPVGHKFVGKHRLRFVVAANVFADILEITRKRTHADASDADEINVMDLT